MISFLGKIMPEIQLNRAEMCLSPAITLEIMRGSTNICRSLIRSSPGKVKYVTSLADILMWRKAKPVPIPQRKINTKFVCQRVRSKYQMQMT